MVERLTWDTDHFGVPIGRVTGSTVTADDVAEADRLGLNCLYLLVEAEDTRAVANAEDLGFCVVDERITLGRTVVGEKPVTRLDPSFAAVRPAVMADMVALEPVVRTAHIDSRFFADPNFGREAAATLYVAWLRSSVAGGLADVALVAEDAGAPAGYITGRIAPDRETMAIGLFGVAEAARGRGLGSRLLAALFAVAAQGAIPTVTVVTQGANAVAQRVYQAAGFRRIRSELWLHRWAHDRQADQSGGMPFPGNNHLGDRCA